MYEILQFIIGVLLIDRYYYVNSDQNKFKVNGTSYQIKFFEYGVHVEGEVVSFQTTGHIEPFTTVHVQNVTPQRRDVEKRYTYLRLEYVSPMSEVDIEFDVKHFLITFHVRFPIYTIPYGIVGYSVRMSQNSHVWNIWQ